MYCLFLLQVFTTGLVATSTAMKSSALWLLRYAGCTECGLCPPDVHRARSRKRA